MPNKLGNQLGRTVNFPSAPDPKHMRIDKLIDKHLAFSETLRLTDRHTHISNWRRNPLEWGKWNWPMVNSTHSRLDWLPYNYSLECGWNNGRKEVVDWLSAEKMREFLRPGAQFWPLPFPTKLLPHIKLGRFLSYIIFAKFHNLRFKHDYTTVTSRVINLIYVKQRKSEGQ